MSLINDALKRAKEAQPQAAPPPVPSLQLRPIEPAQSTKNTLGLILPFALGVAAVLLLLLVWQSSQRNGSVQPTDVKARTAMATYPASAPQPTAASVAPASAAPVPAVQPIPSSPPAPSAMATAALPDLPAPAVAATLTNDPVAEVQGATVTNTPPVAEAPPPKPSLPKLQAIIFSPAKPSVMIGGKTLFIGDKLNGFRVIAIDQESATLVSAGQTNILSLSE
jgi:hypothetical protein